MPSGRAATALGNLIFIPMFLLGGGGPPRDVMTGPDADALRRAAAQPRRRRPPPLVVRAPPTTRTCCCGRSSSPSSPSSSPSAPHGIGSAMAEAPHGSAGSDQRVGGVQSVRGWLPGPRRHGRPAAAPPPGPRPRRRPVRGGAGPRPARGGRRRVEVPLRPELRGRLWGDTDPVPDPAADRAGSGPAPGREPVDHRDLHAGRLHQPRLLLGPLPRPRGRSPSAYRARWAATGAPHIPGCYLFMWGLREVEQSGRSVSSEGRPTVVA